MCSHSQWKTVIFPHMVSINVTAPPFSFSFSLPMELWHNCVSVFVLCRKKQRQRGGSEVQLHRNTGKFGISSDKLWWACRCLSMQVVRCLWAVIINNIFLLHRCSQCRVLRSPVPWPDNKSTSVSELRLWRLIRRELPLPLILSTIHSNNKVFLCCWVYQYNH